MTGYYAFHQLISKLGSRIADAKGSMSHQDLNLMIFLTNTVGLYPKNSCYNRTHG